jgi:glycosyltransferase involved in cell wall biosynthesis
VIVVDDGSEDDSPSVAEEFGARVLRREHPGGPNVARNVAIKEAAGEWIAFCDSDDEWLPFHLETLWRLREGNVLVGAGSVHMADGKVRYAGVLSRRPTRLEHPGPLLFPGHLVTTSATMVRTDRLRELGGFPDRRRAGDLACWCRVLEAGTGVLTAEVTVLYGVHPGQMSEDIRPTLDAHLEIANSYRHAPWLSGLRMHLIVGRAQWDALREAQRERQWDMFGEHLRELVRPPQRVAGALLTVLRRRGLALRSKPSPERLMAMRTAGVST